MICVLLLSAASFASVHAQQYVISTIAGGAPPVTPARAVNISVGSPSSIATDAAGNVHFTSLNSVFKLDKNGLLTIVAGNSRAGYSGDGGPATSAQLNAPAGLVFDAEGNLYIADSGNFRIRKVLGSGIIVTIAGNGTAGFSGDQGPATSAQLGSFSLIVLRPFTTPHT